MPSIDDNRRHWNDEYDWSDRGDERTPDAVWKAQILRYAMEPHLGQGCSVLEIGPGGGRWTQELLRYRPRELTGVDLSERCVAMCRERFADHPEARFVVNDGKSLGCVQDDSIDFAWSFDVFVHMERDTIAAYLAELRRVMRAGATAVVHYPSIDRAKLPDRYQGWRGDVRSGDMLEMLAHERFELLHDYYEEWISATNTSVAVFHKARAESPDPEGA